MKFKYPYGATPIDEDEALELIPTHIYLQDELNEYEELNILNAAKKYFNRSIGFSEILSFNFLLEVHKNMFDKTWKWAGKTRKSTKNIGVEVTQIYENIKNLCDDAKYWIDKEIFQPDEIGARFHHRLVQIHLFPNGNGRHSRFVTDMLMKSLGQPAFTWGDKDLYHESDVRHKYISALKEADKNNYNPLIEFVKS